MDRHGAGQGGANSVSLKDRIAAWYIFGQIAHTLGLSREELKARLTMVPFPKWVGYLAGLVAMGSQAWQTMHPGSPLPGWLTTLSALVAMFSHSATGTGGEPPK